jgi:hypothetical protein
MRERERERERGGELTCFHHKVFSLFKYETGIFQRNNVK